MFVLLVQVATLGKIKKDAYLIAIMIKSLMPKLIAWIQYVVKKSVCNIVNPRVQLYKLLEMTLIVLPVAQLIQNMSKKQRMKIIVESVPMKNILIETWLIALNVLGLLLVLNAIKQVTQNI